MIVKHRLQVTIFTHPIPLHHHTTDCPTTTHTPFVQPHPLSDPLLFRITRTSMICLGSSTALSTASHSIFPCHTTLEQHHTAPRQHDIASRIGTARPSRSHIASLICPLRCRPYLAPTVNKPRLRYVMLRIYPNANHLSSYLLIHLFSMPPPFFTYSCTHRQRCGTCRRRRAQRRRQACRALANILKSCSPELVFFFT